MAKNKCLWEVMDTMTGELDCVTESDVDHAIKDMVAKHGKDSKVGKWISQSGFKKEFIGLNQEASDDENGGSDPYEYLDDLINSTPVKDMKIKE